MGRNSNTYTVKYIPVMCSDLHKKSKITYTCPKAKHRKEVHLKMEESLHLQANFLQCALICTKNQRKLN